MEFFLLLLMTSPCEPYMPDMYHRACALQAMNMCHEGSDLRSCISTSMFVCEHAKDEYKKRARELCSGSTTINHESVEEEKTKKPTAFKRDPI